MYQEHIERGGDKVSEERASYGEIVRNAEGEIDYVEWTKEHAIAELLALRQQNAAMTAEHKALRQELADALEAKEKAEEQLKLDTIMLTHADYLQTSLQVELAQAKEQLAEANTAKVQAEEEKDRLNNYFDGWKDELAKRQELEKLLAAAQAWEQQSRQLLMRLAGDCGYEDSGGCDWCHPLRVILSTPASEYAKRVEKMEAVVEAAVKWKKVPTSEIYQAQEALFAAIDALKEEKDAKAE